MTSKLMRHTHDLIYYRCWRRLRRRRLEDLPDRAVLLRAIHIFHVHTEPPKRGELKRSFFKDSNGVSCDLAWFASKRRARLGLKEPPWPPQAGLAKFVAGMVRAVAKKGYPSDVEHAPYTRVSDHTCHFSHCQFCHDLTDGQARSLKNETTILKSYDFP